MTIKVATFDLDGTLIKRSSRLRTTLKMDAINHSISKVFSINDINYVDYLGKEMYGMTDRAIVREVLYKLDIDRAVADKKIDYLFEEILKYFYSSPNRKSSDDYIILPGVIELLDTLQNRGIELGLATGNYEEFAWWKLKGVDLDRYFTFGGFGEDNESRSGIIASALKRSNHGKDFNACHFGDTPSDIESARNNDIMSAAVSSKGGGTFDTDELRTAGADLVVDSWTEIDKILALFDR